MKILVLHHTDLDGAGSAAVVGLYHQGDEVIYKSHNYGWPLSPDDLQGYDLIYAVDISFGQDNPWVYEDQRLVWIDHHKTALEYESLHPELHSIPGLRAIGKGACELCWEYLYPHYRVPDLIQVLSTYDVWWKDRMDWDTVMKIETGAKHILGISPKAVIDFIVEGRKIEELKSIGETILGYIEKSGKGKLMSGGFWLPDFHGLRTIALCTPDFSSLSFLSCLNPGIADAFFPFQVVSGENGPWIRFSLYSESDNVDVSEIAKLYSGGGHKKASGGRMSMEVLSSILSAGRPLKEYFKEIGYRGEEPRYYENKKYL